MVNILAHTLLCYLPAFRQSPQPTPDATAKQSLRAPILNPPQYLYAIPLHSHMVRCHNASRCHVLVVAQQLTQAAQALFDRLADGRRAYPIPLRQFAIAPAFQIAQLDQLLLLRRQKFQLLQHLVKLQLPPLRIKITAGRLRRIRRQHLIGKITDATASNLVSAGHLPIPFPPLPLRAHGRIQLAHDKRRQISKILPLAPLLQRLHHGHPLYLLAILGKIPKRISVCDLTHFSIKSLQNHSQHLFIALLRQRHRLGPFLIFIFPCNQYCHQNNPFSPAMVILLFKTSNAISLALKPSKQSVHSRSPPISKKASPTQMLSPHSSQPYSTLGVRCGGSNQSDSILAKLPTTHTAHPHCGGQPSCA